ncbi:MAG TPA: YceH family protein [Conexibacter sp.]|nr:YceH family protein [Conexibacter sp.]
MEPDAVEIRVLGCLIEKQRTTPDAYPLSLNALRLACNQATNRNPVAAYDEAAIKDALQRTYRRGWTRLASGHGSRAAKYRHLLDEALGLAPDELALLAVLMLRGDQTPGELKQRSERLHRFADLAAVEATLQSLIARGHAAQLPRQPGQKEERYRQLLGGDQAEPAAPIAPPAHAAHADPAAAPAHADRAGGVAEDDSAAPPAKSPRATTGPARSSAEPERGHQRRIERLEKEVADLRAQLSALRDALGA